MKKGGYARVSTAEQSLALQMAALQTAGCQIIFSDKGISGTAHQRPGLDNAIEALEPGDMLVVWRLDRLGRSLVHLVTLINKFAAENVDFRSLSENMDTSSSGGRLVFHMMAALAEFERNLISERTRAGLLAVQSRGKKLGRPPLLSTEDRLAAIEAIKEGEHIADIAGRYKVHPRTLNRALKNFPCDISIAKVPA